MGQLSSKDCTCTDTMCFLSLSDCLLRRSCGESLFNKASRSSMVYFDEKIENMEPNKENVLLCELELFSFQRRNLQSNTQFLQVKGEKIFHFKNQFVRNLKYSRTCWEVVQIRIEEFF